AVRVTQHRRVERDGVRPALGVADSGRGAGERLAGGADGHPQALGPGCETGLVADPQLAVLPEQRRGQLEARTAGLVRFSLLVRACLELVEVEGAAGKIVVEQGIDPLPGV